MSRDEAVPFTPVAIVGISALFPGSLDTPGFWRDIAAGADRLTDVPRTHWLRDDYFAPTPRTPDKVYTARGGFLPPTEFSPLEFGLPPNTLPVTDSSQLLGLVVAKRVLAEATRGRLESVDRSRMSVVLGVASATSLVAHMSGRLQLPVAERAMRTAGLDEDDIRRVRDVLASCYTPWQENTFPGLLGNVVAGRIANRFDLGGTNAVVDAACASSFAALEIAVNDLALRRSDLVVTGGVDTLNDILMFMCFAQTGALSIQGDCKPFSDEADGTMLGEGVGMVALKRLADAERDGDPIYAVIRGVGSSSDGRGNCIYAPLPAGQARALRRAYEAAGYGPSTVELVEAHGTATKAGDAAEMEALRMVWEEANAAPESCAVGSVKAQIGHTKASAGAAGLIKTALALHHKVLPPTIKVKKRNPTLKIEGSAFYVNTELRPWVRGSDHPRRASVSSFGFGGTNFHITLEEYTGPAPRPERVRALPTELVLFSGRDAAAVAAACRSTSETCEAAGTLVHLAKRSQSSFDAKAPARLAIVATDEVDLKKKLVSAAAALAEPNAGAFSWPNGVHFATGEATGGVALLFPGQGSQYPGMGSELAAHFDVARAVWDQVPDVARFAFPPPRFVDAEREEDERRLTATENAQPAITAASLAILGLLERVGLAATCVGGHSLGEVGALRAAGASSDGVALSVARTRGAIMANASRDVPGAMTSVVAPRRVVERLVAEWKLDVVVANDNAPQQVVLSGATPAIEEAERRLDGEKLAYRRLRVATAFHSSLVGGACTPFRAELERLAFEAPRVPSFSNSTAAPYPSSPAALREQLANAIALPVRFVEQIEAMYAAGARTFVEVGPGSVLTKLVARILEGRPHLAVATDERGKNGVTALWETLGRLSVAGVTLKLEALWEGDRLPEDPSTKVAPKLAVAVTGATPSKPYPPASGELRLPANVAPAKPKPAPAPVAAVPVAAPPPVAPPRAAHVDSNVLTAAIAAQREFERLMAESHMTFLRALEGTGLGASTTTAPRVPVAPVMPVAPPRFEPPPAPVPVQVAAPPPRPVVAAVAKPSVDLVPLMLAIVSEKTGYPVEMIEMTMDLEGELGIDSIKRVEILSAVRERAPGLPEVDTAKMATLRTLQQIVDYLAPSHGTAKPAANGTPAKPTFDLVPLMLTIVSEKTGYPVEMIEMTMDLEGELGIDSIKRVEILSAVRERAPGLPEVDTAKMATLRTLQQIVDYLGGAPKTVAEKPAPLPTNGSTAARSAAPVGRFAVRAVPAAPSGFATPGLLGARKVAVTSDGGAIAPAVVDALRARGVAATLVDTAPADADAVLFLGGLRETSNVDEAIAVDRDAFVEVRALAERFREHGGTFIAVQDTGGDFAVSGACADRAWLAGVGALAKTLAQECPKAIVRAIDVERGGRDAGAIASALVDELLRGGVEIEIGLRKDGTRVRIDGVAARVESGGSTIEAGAVFVVTGGARGVTATSLVALAKATRPRFVLLGRTPTTEEPAAFRGLEGDAALKRAALEEAKRSGKAASPKDIARTVAEIVANREVKETLRQLREAGSDARYATVDARDRAALGALLDDVRRTWGPIRGVVHGAGVLSDAFLDKKTDAQFDLVWGTKVEGLRALLDATTSDPLGWLCLFSSVAARAGNAGQADYAMANEVLNKVAAVEARRRGTTCRVVSIGWGPWEGGMVTPELARLFEKRGVSLLPLRAGAAAFVEELGARGDVEVVIGGGTNLAGGDARKVEVEVLVDRATYPQLESHRIQGNVVLPMVIALEWFARVARSLSPNGGIFRDVRTVRGVQLGAYDRGGDRFRIVATPSDRSWALALHDAAGALRYTATFDVEPPPRTQARPSTPEGAAASSDRLYGPKALFHGPDFQVLRDVRIADDRASATVVATSDMGWPAGTWSLDPAALDGALQLGFLFGLERGRGPSLPLGIERVLHHRTSEGPLRCEIQQRESSQERTIYDMALTQPDGSVAVELLGVAMYVVPSGTTAN